MLFSSALQAFGGLVALCSMASAAPSNPKLDMDLPFFDMTWTGEAVPGAGNITLSGTIERIHEQLLAINPEHGSTMNASGSSVEKEESRGLEKRTIAYIDCDVPPNAAPADEANLRWEPHYPIKDAIKYLKKHGGMCTVQPMSCTRIACSWKLGLHLCNPTPGKVFTAECQYLGSVMAAAIYAECLDEKTSKIKGTAWDTTGGYLTIAQDQC